MPLHWTVTLECSDCGAALRYEDERPEWQEDEEVKADLGKARKYVEANPKLSAGQSIYGLPPYVGCDPIFTGKTFVKQDICTRYVACPACGGKAYPEVPDA